MPRIIFDDHDPDTGDVTGHESESYSAGGPAGSTIATESDPGVALIGSGILGQDFGTGGYRGGATGGTSSTGAQTAAQVEQTRTRQTSEAHHERGYMILRDPFLAKYVPLYDEAAARHSAAVTKALEPLMTQVNVIKATRISLEDKERAGALGGALETIFSDPTALVALGGTVLSGGALAPVFAARAAQDALKGWAESEGIGGAIARLRAKEAELNALVASKVKAAGGTYLPFQVMVEQMVDRKQRAPKGVVWKGGGDSQDVVGDAPLPGPFVSWFKHKHKMANQRGVRKFRLT